MYYAKVKYKDGTKIRTMWAIPEARGDVVSLFMPVDREGDYKTVKEKGHEIQIKVLLSNSLILSVVPAYMDLHYGVLKIDKSYNML